MVDVN
jgi:hypothetical protein